MTEPPAWSTPLSVPFAGWPTIERVSVSAFGSLHGSAITVAVWNAAAAAVSVHDGPASRAGQETVNPLARYTLRPFGATATPCTPSRPGAVLPAQSLPPEF